MTTRRVTDIFCTNCYCSIAENNPCESKGVPIHYNERAKKINKLTKDLSLANEKLNKAELLNAFYLEGLENI